ncbi:unnamed protein product, partial [Prorocentrum cordatum]
VAVFQSKCHKHVSERLQEASDHAAAKKWTGCIAKVDGRVEGDDHVFGGIIDCCVPAASPWLAILLRGAFKELRSSVSLPGVGHVVQALSEDLFFVSLPIDNILGAGVSLGDLTAFMETAEAAKVVKDVGIIQKLKPMQCVYIPWGWLFMPFHVNVDRAKKVEPTEFAGIWMQPYWNVEAMKIAPHNVLEAVLNYNVEVLTRTG